MGLLDNLNFSQPFRISSLLPSEAQLQSFKDKSDAEALEQFSQDPNPIRRVPFNILTALGVNPTIAQAAPTTLDVAPVTGDISALADARTAFGQGDLATAGLLTAATILPGVPAGKVKGLLKKSDDTKPLLNVDDAPKEGIANVVPPTDTDSGIIAFHGSGADFDQFRMDKIGTGEGAQAFGYGLYFTDSEDIAKFYKNAVGGQEIQAINVKGSDFKDLNISQSAKNLLEAEATKLDNIFLKSDLNQDLFLKKANTFGLDSPVGKAYNEIVEAGIKPKDIKKIFSEGKTYKVALAPKPDELLDYDKPLSEQSDLVKSKLQELNIIRPGTNLELIESADYFKQNGIDPTGKELMDFVATTLPAEDFYSPNRTQIVPKKISEKLNSVGIKGIKYKAGQLSGVKDTDATNFVIFDENLINILAKYGIVGSVGITALQNSDI